MKDALGDSVMKVAVSSRLTDAPACITAAGPVSLEMERIMAQMPDGGEGIKSERVLEVNAKHAVSPTGTSCGARFASAIPRMRGTAAALAVLLRQPGRALCVLRTHRRVASLPSVILSG